MKPRDITGLIIGKLTAINRVIGSAPTKWLCSCECGNKKEICLSSLVKGSTKSCGCLWRVGKGLKTTTENKAEYNSWIHIKARCLSPKNRAYKYYGGRGITICDLWKDSFQEFLKHIGKKPTNKHTVDRINNDGNYEPGNVRWATMAQQSVNRRVTRLLTYKGRTMALSEWAKELGIESENLSNRLKLWTDEDKIFSKDKFFKNGIKRKTAELTKATEG